MTAINKLLSVGSEPLAPQPKAIPEMLGAFTLGPELVRMLHKKNGFYAFEAALHVFPLTGDPETGLVGWNAVSLWRNDYEDLAEGLLFFGEDILQDQFCLSVKQPGVFRFHSETGELVFIADTIEGWAGVVLSNYQRETGWPFVHEWQAKNGLIPFGKRLMPKTPFFLGGEYNLHNFWVGNSLEGMRLKADLARQTRHLPEGSAIKLRIAPKPE